jgi:DNA-directed RNA polymerase specialized sigma24 family protein
MLGDGGESAESLSPEAVMSKMQDRALVDEALQRLTPDCKRLLQTLFSTNEPLSYQDISATLEMPIGSIGPTRKRCLDRLAKVLNEIGF